MTPTAIRRKNEAAQRSKERKERMQQHIDNLDRIYQDKDANNSTKPTESEQDAATNVSGVCPCGYQNINDCLNCRINKKVPSLKGQSTDTADTTDKPDMPNAKANPEVKTENFTDNPENANNMPSNSTQQAENFEFEPPSHTFEVRGQIVEVPHSTPVYFLDPKSNYPPHLATYEVRGCIVGVLHGTPVRFL